MVLRTGEDGRSQRTRCPDDACNPGLMILDSQPPALVSEAVLGAVERERVRVVRVDRVTHKAARRVRVQADHEEEGEVVCVPARGKGKRDGVERVRSTERRAGRLEWRGD